MGSFSGPQGKGAKAKHKENKRVEAEVRNEAYQLKKAEEAREVKLQVEAKELEEEFDK